MDITWNDFELKKPPFLTLPTSYTEFVVELHGTISNYFSKYALHEEEFNETAALLGRLMARRKNSFAKMKGFKVMCKLNTALCRLLRVDFKRDLDIFRCTLPDVEYEEGIVVHMPTRDNCDFLLLRLIALCELYKRIGECCVEAADYFTIQLRVHYFFETNTLLVAVIAKMYSLGIRFGNLAINLYNSLQSYRSKFPLNQKSKFSLKSDLPDQLELIKKPKREEQKSDAVKNLKATANKSISDLIQLEQKTTNTTVKTKNFKKTDLGTAVERSQDRKQFDINKLGTTKAIKDFILKETKARTKSLTSCITKQVLSHEWSGATKLFERKIRNGEEKKAVNIFKKFIGSKI